jgi:hypothetical protein
MTIQLRRDKEIYATDGGWFQARWHFTFDRYYDPEQMGVGPLRVFNDGRLEPGAAQVMRFSSRGALHSGRADPHRRAPAVPARGRVGAGGTLAVPGRPRPASQEEG